LIFKDFLRFFKWFLDKIFHIDFGKISIVDQISACIMFYCLILGLHQLEWQELQVNNKGLILGTHSWFTSSSMGINLLPFEVVAHFQSFSYWHSISYGLHCFLGKSHFGLQFLLWGPNMVIANVILICMHNCHA
jgi:hypothetical protein